MKLLFENWRKYLLEASYFGEKFDEYKKLVEEGKDPLKTADKMFKRLGQGSTRVVFALPDTPDFVLKVINTDFGALGYTKRDIHGFTPQHKRRSNEWEADIQLQLKHPELFPRSTEHAPDYSWILVERVDPISAKEFFDILQLPSPPRSHGALTTLIATAIEEQKKYVNESFADEETVVNPPAADPLGGPTARQAVAPPPPQLGYAERKKQEIAANVKALLKNPQVVRILNLMTKYDIKHTEFKPSNMGISKMSGNKLVFLDTSMWEDA